MNHKMSIPHAILLLGPTGSGKTPLGEMLQARGLGDGRRCVHFDFGDRLRRIAAGQLGVDELTGADLEFIGDVLDHGALLEDEHFHVAEKILRAFINQADRGNTCDASASNGDSGTKGRVRVTGADEASKEPGHSGLATGYWLPATNHPIIVLNGLPRHVSQAGDVDRIVEVRAVVELSCTPETVLARLAANTGGDRAGRIDDEPARALKKLELYARRTEPLLDHYRSLGAAGISLTVGPDTTAENAWRELIAKAADSRE